MSRIIGSKSPAGAWLRLPLPGLLLLGSVTAATSIAAAQDTIHVRSSSAPRWGSTVKLTPVFSIGSVDGPEEYAFGSVGNVVVDRKGRMYLHDQQYGQIREYDPSGKFLRNIGRKGGGPGEYQSADGMTIANDTVLTIHDPSAARVSYFYPDGKLRGNFVDRRLTWGSGNSFVVDREGLTYLRVPMLQPSEGQRVSESDIVRSMRLLRMRPNGVVVDTLALPASLPHDAKRSFYLMSADGGNSNFQPESFSASLPSGGFVAVNGDAFRLLIKRPQGAPTIVERAFIPVPVGDDERANWQEYAVYMAGRDKGGPKREYQIPRTKPVFRDLLVDADSRIWLSVYATARKIVPVPLAVPRPGPRLRWNQAATYEVFSDGGIYLGRVELPMRSRLLTAQGDRIWVLGKGADDEDIVRVYSLSGSAPIK